MHYGHASVCVKFVCIVCDIIFVLSYSRPLTLRVCLQGDGERMERVQESFELRDRKRERERWTVRPRGERDGVGREDRQEMKGSKRNGWDSLTSCTECAHSPCDEKQGRLVSSITRACRISCVRALRHAGNSVNCSLISNTCRHGDHGRAVMNDQGQTREHAAHAPGQLRLLVICLFFCWCFLALWIFPSPSFIQGGVVWEQLFFFSNSLFSKRKHKT